jgi:hypothetical protein
VIITNSSRLFSFVVPINLLKITEFGATHFHWMFLYTKLVKLSLCFNWARRYEGVLRECRYSSTHCLTSELNGGELSVLHPGRFTPRERAPPPHWKGGWVRPRAVLDAVVKRKISGPRQESNPRTPIVQPVAQRYTDWSITALYPKLVVLQTTKFLSRIQRHTVTV